MKKYVVQWQSKVNGRVGKGTKLFDYEEGHRLVKELNAEYPQIEHQLLECAAPAPAESPPAEPELELEEAQHARQEQPAGVH